MFTGELGGVSVDLVRELARRLDVRVVLVGFDFSGSLADALASGVLDIGGIARGSGRKGTLDFSPGYLQIETTDDRFLVVEQTLAIPKGREAGLRYLREFIEEMKASGFVKRALVRSGNPHVLVAPPESK